MIQALKTKITNSLRESVRNLLNMFYILPDTRPRTVMTHREFLVWKTNYFAQHKDHPIQAARAMGRAFCQDHKLRDHELNHCEKRAWAELRILARYVDPNRTS